MVGTEFGEEDAGSSSFGGNAVTRVLVAYGTGDGQAAHVAHAIADRLRERGVSPYVADLQHESPSLEDFAGAVIGGSVHAAKFQVEVRDYVKQHVERLNVIPSWFFGVSLSEAGKQAPVDPQNAGKQIAAFLADTAWAPRRELSVAGALKYREYNPLKRFVMKHIARKAGGDTDTSHDWEYTNWEQVSEFADTVVDTMRSADILRLSTT